MALHLGDDVVFVGPALPEAFVRHELEKVLGTHLPKARTVQGEWEKYRKSLRQPFFSGGSGHVDKHAVAKGVGAAVAMNQVCILEHGFSSFEMNRSGKGCLFPVPL